jgi:uncharacterized repeat protein (TIGR02543 family)
VKSEKVKKCIAGFILCLTVLVFFGCFLFPEDEDEVDADSYTVTYNANGGSGKAPAKQVVKIDYGVNLSLPDSLKKTGYYFAKWNTKADGTGTDYYPGFRFLPTSNTTLYAKWVTGVIDGLEESPFPLIEDFWYNDSITSSTPGKSLWYSFNVTKGAKYNVWVNTGYGTTTGSFIGGDGTKTLLPRVSASYNGGESIFEVSYAWTAPESFTAASTGTVKIKVGSPPDYPGFTGTFAIAYSIGSTRPGSSSNSYTVTYNLNGGTGTTPPSQTTGTAITLAGGTGFSRDGYVFDGWNTSPNGLGTNYTAGSSYRLYVSNIVLYARWFAVYTVAYNANGGTGTMENSSLAADIAENLRANTFTRTGYTFIGWATTLAGTVQYTDGQSVSNLASEAGATVTLYAVWDNKFTVAYDANGGSGEMATSGFTIGVSQNLQPNIFSNTGYTFAGWATSPSGTAVYTDGQSLSSPPATGATVTLYAVWIGNTYTVVYNANGGDGYMEPSGFTYGVEQPLRANTFTRTKYRLIGWAFSPTGEGTPIENVVYANGQSVSNLTPEAGGTVTLYAVWAPAYTVVYNNSGGIGVMEPSEFAWGVEERLRPNTFTRTNYVFAGWDVNETANDVFYNDEQIVSNLTLLEMITLYAVWRQGQ